MEIRSTDAKALFKMPLDPAITTLEGLLREEEAATPASRFADALRAAVLARRQIMGYDRPQARVSIAPYRLSLIHI